VSRQVLLHNRQRIKPVDARYLRRLLRGLLQEELHLEEFELGIYLVGDELMTQINEQHLHHAGTTDVITFDYQDRCAPEKLAGELFVCVPEAVRQSARFHCTWQQEVVRYLVHGILHLRGYDDVNATLRRRMKREENRLLRRVALRFSLSRLSSVAGG
jgi:probable rRNA maturation factor